MRTWFKILLISSLITANRIQTFTSKTNRIDDNFWYAAGTFENVIAKNNHRITLHSIVSNDKIKKEEAITN